MFTHHDLTGNGLAPKTLCLTYDDGPGETAHDGPGPRTEAIASYLYDEGIAGTFFVIGRHVQEHISTLDKLRCWGHLIGNHTFNHFGLVDLAKSGGDVVDELSRTESIIRPYVTSDVVFMRPPYGSWRDPAAGVANKIEPISIVADLLNRSGRFSNYVGPVIWDISAADYDFWRSGASAEEAAEAYYREIERIGRGIVLMHDSSEDEQIRANHRTFELTRLLVPRLKQDGYRFVGLDSALAVS
jgi:peptidoglycan/xylan/chitin deacetylase (PgdA/CDA1 family)